MSILRALSPSNFFSQRRHIEANTVLFIDAATSCLQKPSANAKEIPLHLRGKALSLEDSTNRKPSRLDHFCDGHDPCKPYLWEDFTSATPTFNKDQKRVDLSKDRRLWYYLGKSSTESKAHYTNDPAKPINDPASNFLQSVEPAKRPLIPQPQPVRRQSLPASYPGHYSVGVNVPRMNAAMAAPRLTQAERLEQQKMDDYQRRMAILGAPAAPASSAQYFNSHPAAGNQSPIFAFSSQARNPASQLPADPVAREAMLAKQRAILERSQQRAMVLDQQDRPHLYKTKSSMPSPNIGIDTQSVERQREFQRRAYQQSLASSQLSPHSPGMYSGFITNGETPQWGQCSSPEIGTSYAPSQASPNTAQYGQASPSPTEAAFPIMRRPHQQPITSSLSDPQHNNYQVHTQSISSQQQPLQVNFFHHQRRLSQPTYPYPQLSHQPQPSPSPLHHLKMSSSASSAPIDIPQQRSNMSASVRTRNLGQHTANFIDPNLMQLSPNHQTFSAPSDMTEAKRDKAVQASRSMPPPPIPSQSSQPTVTTTTTGYQPKYADYDRDYVSFMAAEQAADAANPNIVTAFCPKLNEVLAEMKKKEEQQKSALISDKPIPQSIATLRYMSDTRKFRPNVYTSPYAHGYGSADGATVKEGTTKYGNGLLSKVVEGDEGNELDGEEWVDLKQARPRSKEDEDATLESEYVRVEIDRKGKRQIDPVGGGLANRYYAARSVEEKQKIDREMKKMGWLRGSEK